MEKFEGFVKETGIGRAGETRSSFYSGCRWMLRNCVPDLKTRITRSDLEMLSIFFYFFFQKFDIPLATHFHLCEVKIISPNLN